MYVSALSYFIHEITGSSLVAWWLGFWAFTAIAQVQSLVRELRSRKTHGMPPQNNNRDEETKSQRLSDLSECPRMDSKDSNADPPDLEHVFFFFEEGKVYAFFFFFLAALGLSCSMRDLR